MKLLNVAAYCRVSTDKDDQANSLKSQRSYFEDYIRQHEGWQFCLVYYDEGISGTQAKHRQGFQDMVQAAMAGRIDLILTKEVSRFARNTVDTLSYTRKLKAAGVGVLFTIDHIDTRDSDGELRLTIMASIAQEESRKTSERVKWGQKRRMEQGVVFGRDLLGYTVKDGALLINENETPAVRAIFHKYTNEGKGTQIIARELLEQGLYPKQAERWSNTMILKVLRNEKYVGDLCQKKNITPDYLTHEKKINHGEEEMVYLTDHHQSIIGRELWERTRRELACRSPGTKQQAGTRNRYWYSGRLFCGLCGAVYVSRTKKRKDGSVYKCYRCGKSVREGRSKINGHGLQVGCDGRQINEEALLACLRHLIGHIEVNDESLRKEILDDIQRIQEIFPKKDRGRMKREMKTLQDRKLTAVDLTARGVITEQELREQKRWYDEKIQKLQCRLEKARSEEKIQGQQGNGWGRYAEELEEILELKQDSHFLVKEVLDRVILREDSTMDVYLKCAPFPVRIHYQSHGKGAGFATKILDMKIMGGLCHGGEEKMRAAATISVVKPLKCSQMMESSFCKNVSV